MLLKTGESKEPASIKDSLQSKEGKVQAQQEDPYTDYRVQLENLKQQLARLHTQESSSSEESSPEYMN